MARKAWKAGEPVVIEAARIHDLVSWLSARGYDVIGPKRDGDVIRFGHLGAASELPAGLTDTQERGTYSVVPGTDGLIFGHNNGPGSLKEFLFPADRLLQTADRQGRLMSVSAPTNGHKPVAFLGCRACDLAALQRLDRVLLEGPYVDADYAARRKSVFIVAVGCSTVAPTCFCASMGTGPRPTTLFDLCLTEVLDRDGHRFVVEVGTELGAKALGALPHEPATPALANLPQIAAERAEERMVRGVDPNAATIVAANREHALWDDIGARCLTCGNCTAVCPTCFCHTVEDTTDLAGHHAERRRKWDSCFTMGFSFVNGGSVRYSAASRYRHWLTHKFSTWHDQFGSSGCVGCGRCITWCPVGIDVTEEIKRLGGVTPVPTETP